MVGFWDVMDLGAAAAIKESGKPIVLVTSGGGEQMACDNVDKGVFDKEIAYQVMDQGRDLNDMISTVLEIRPAGRQAQGGHLQPAAHHLQGDASAWPLLERERTQEIGECRRVADRAEPPRRLSAFSCQLEHVMTIGDWAARLRYRYVPDHRRRRSARQEMDGQCHSDRSAPRADDLSHRDDSEFHLVRQSLRHVAADRRIRIDRDRR